MIKTSNVFAALLVLTFLAVSTGCKHKKAAPAPQSTPVTVISAVIKDAPIEYDSSGSITPLVNPLIRSQLAGTVESVEVKLGQTVTKNQLLIRLINTTQQLQYEQAQAQLNSARAKLQAAQAAKNSKGELVKSGVVAKLDYLNAVATAQAAAEQVTIDQKNVALYQEQLEHTLIKSPIDGSVEQIMVSSGDNVSPSTPLIKLVNNTRLQATLSFAQQLAGQLKVGQTINLFSPATPGKEYLGTVTSVSPSINPNNRSINVIIEFQGDNAWYPGASITGKVYSQESYPIILVPTEAVVTSNDGSFVFVIENNHAIAYSATPIFHAGANTAIRSNIRNGQLIAVLGAQYLGNGSLVNIKKD